MSTDDEAEARNAILSCCHGRIPSYALWRGCDVERESLLARIEWWTTLDSRSADPRVVKAVDFWRSKLVSSSVARAISAANVDEYDAML
jgi:hypothetical protein